MRYRLSIFFLSAFALFFAGCGDEDVPFVSDTDEITRFVTSSADGRELFRADSLMLEVDFTVANGTASYIDIIDSVTRTIDVDIRGPFDFGNLGQLKEAVAVVNDLFYVRTLRADSVFAPIVSRTRLLQRYGYFLKLGDDSRPFLGWKLYGYNGFGASSAPLNVSVRTTDGNTSFIGDDRSLTNVAKALGMSYIKLEDIEEIENGSTLLIETKSLSPKKYYNLLSVASSAGFVTTPMSAVDSIHHTVSLKMSTTNSRFWDIMMIQTLKDSIPAGNLVKAWCIPYRVKQ
jgi:hypothetical protein